ncbi:MAG: 2-polyprenylphenol 6-hydroxylase [Deltaproteobacteria bacterium]|nr:2-polyprenylphenol 6-hydroxylase [Deltaproteobacteria bacterium]
MAQTYKNLRRLNEIVVILIKYGFGSLAKELHILPAFIAGLERLFVSKKRLEGLSTPERIRLMLEELGPTYIKLGQIASTRADLLPPDWINEFKKLQDMVPPVSFEEVRKVVENSLKGPISSKFAFFDTTPIASASIAQVHYAELLDGTKVAVKVKRPGIAKIIESDISVMYTIAGLLDKYVPASRRYRPKDVVDEFARIINSEQDLSIEGVNANRFYGMFKGDPIIQIPKVYWDYTTEDLLTMERISGTPIDEVETLMNKGVDIKKAAIQGIEIFFKQVFEHGIFHADLHPGNIFIRDDGVIIYLDFGIIGRIDRDLRKYLASMLFHLIRGDYYRMAAVHRDMGLIGDEVNLHEFEEALRDISEPIFGRTLEQINISGLLMKLIQTARRFNMTLQPNLLLLQKSMVIIEGVGRQLYPDVNMWEVAKPLIYKWMIREKLSPKAVAKKGRLKVEELIGAASELPLQMNSILGKAIKDEFKIGFVHHRLETVSNELETAGRRIGGGLIVASVVLASSLIAVFSKGETITFLGLPVLSDAGFVIAIALGYKFFSAGKKQE